MTEKRSFTAFALMVVVPLLAAVGSVFYMLLRWVIQ